MKPRIIMGHQHTSMMVEKGRHIIKFPDNRYICKTPTMAERAEKLAAHLNDERKFQFYENWAEAVINDRFVFSDGSEIEVPVK